MMDFGTHSILVTGASGWLGVNVVRALAQGLPDCEVLRRPQAGLVLRCLVQPGDDSRLGAINSGIELVRGDVRSETDCAEFCSTARGALLIHTAGVIHPKRVADFYDVNVTGTRKLLQAAAAAGVRKAVVVSSNSPCGCNPHPDHLFDETSPYHPYLNYGRSKMLMEQAVREMQQQGRLQTTIIRPPWFYGPNQPPRQTLFFVMIRDGKAPLVGKGNNLRSMVYVDNLVQGILLAALSPAAVGETYWIADERPYAMKEILNVVESLLENEFGQRCAHKRLRLPAFVGSLAYLVDAGLQSLGLYHQKIHVLSEMNKTIACSVAKAQRELGYAPRISLEEGMRRSIASLLTSDGRLPF